MAQPQEAQPQQEVPQQQEAEESRISFDDWIKSQKEPIVSAYEEHVKGLKSALTNERLAHQTLEKQLREMAKKAEAGSESQKELVEMADKIKDEQQRADFYEAAHEAGVKNLKLAYLVATQDGLFQSNGSVNFAKMQELYPELFRSARTPTTNAGSGSRQQTQALRGMNDFIRAATGRHITSEE